MRIADLARVEHHGQYLQIAHTLFSRKGLPRTRYSLRELETMFASEEAIGVYYDAASCADELAYLPSGEQMGRCTNCAWYVVDSLREGEVFGYHIDMNPTVTDDVILACGGHDFAVVGGRYIIDIWVSLYTGSQTRVVFDLNDPGHFGRIRAIYGDPRCWVHFEKRSRRIHEKEQRRASAGLVIHEIRLPEAA